MKTDKPLHGSGKTFFTRLRKQLGTNKGWTVLRDEYIKDGRFRPDKFTLSRIRGMEHSPKQGR